MWNATISLIERTRHSNNFRVHLSIDVDGIEEEAYREYDELPPYLLDKEGKYIIGAPVQVSGVAQDANGFYFMEIYDADMYGGC